jgi:RNA-directed DNA polymerase
MNRGAMASFYLWGQWQTGHNRFNELRHRGVPKLNAEVAAG